MTTESAVPLPAAPRTGALAAALGLLVTAGGLFVYKASGALGVIAKAHAHGTLHAKAGMVDPASLSVAARPLADALDYLGWIVIALAFGTAIAATVRAFVPRRWLDASVGAEGARGQVVAALVGAPLMLCSCCVAPVFEGVYARTRRLGPSLGLMFAAPMLNPAVLAVTFLIFPPLIGWARLGVALLVVLLGATLLGATHRDARGAEACTLPPEPAGPVTFARALGDALVASVRGTLPAILLGVVASAAVVGWVPIDHLVRGHAVLTVVVVALVAVPMALPTFGEIPLAIALVGAGAPLGAAAALIVAGPAVNMPSLLTLGRATSWRVAAATAACVFAAAVGVGWLVLAAG